MLRPIGPLLEYIVYEDYIAEFLCVNKEKPKLNCNGKCYLIQRLKEQDQQKKQNLPKITIEEYPIEFVTLYHILTPTVTIKEVLSSKKYSNLYYFLFSYSNFHPPSNSI